MIAQEGLVLAQVGVQAMVAVIVHILCLVVTWWALMAFRIDVFFKDPSDVRAKILLVLITIAIGSLVGNFFMDYINWSLQLKYMF